MASSSETRTTTFVKAPHRIDLLIRAASEVKLPAATQGCKERPLVPTHVAGYLKRLLLAFKSGVPVEAVIFEIQQMLHQKSCHVTPEVVQWFKELCLARLRKPGVFEAGVYKRSDVNLSRSEIEAIFPMFCPANWGFTSFFDILEEEYDLHRRRRKQQSTKAYEAKQVNITFTNETMVDLLGLQLSICKMLCEGQTWIDIVNSGDEQLQQCLQKTSGTSDQELACRVYMRYMVEFASLWHGWFTQSSVAPEDRDCLCVLIQALYGRLDELREELCKREALVDPFRDFDLLDFSVDCDWLEDDYAIESNTMLRTEDTKCSQSDSISGTNDVNFEAMENASMPASNATAESKNSKTETHFKPSNPMLANFAKFMFKPSSGKTSAGKAGTALRRSSASNNSASKFAVSDPKSLALKMQKLFTADSVVIIRSRLFSTYYRNPKQSIRGFPSLPNGRDYRLSLQDQSQHRKGRGGALQDRMPVVIDVFLEFSPSGGVWVVGEICEMSAEMDTRTTTHTYESGADLVKNAGKHAVVVEANPQVLVDSTENNSCAKKAFRANLLPRVWKYTGFLHKKGTRQSKNFVLRVSVWVFSPRGVGVLATRLESAPFLMSSTQNLRMQKKRSSESTPCSQPTMAVLTKKSRKDPHNGESL